VLDVYKARYKLSGEPFRLSPDPRSCFAHRSYANAKAYLKYAICQGEGFIVVSGGAGTGKTTLISELLAELDQTRVQLATLTNVQLDPRNLLNMVLQAFNLFVEEGTKASPLLVLEKFLKEQSQSGRQSVLIVDEAQGMSPGSLEELRLLSNLQHGSRLLLQIFLVGQEHLLEMIHAPGMEQLRQRLIAASQLEPLDLNETVAYVEHRLSRVGWQGDPEISEDALRLIHKFSGGVPRRINLVCHRLFIYGGLERKHTLVAEDVQHVARELHKERLLTPDLCGGDLLEENVVGSSRDTEMPAISLRSGSTARG